MDADRKHAHFAQDEPLPFNVIAKLGAGAHAHVDKVVSTVSHREFARKLFRRHRGVDKDAIKSFLVELQILKKVHHYHCIELVSCMLCPIVKVSDGFQIQSYTDPRYFALLMLPVGDCNLYQYYNIACNSPDKLSLMRSFFGCLANALQYIHSIKIRHRDIKPHNVLVKGDRVFLTDFGIALDWQHLSRSTTTADSGKTWVYAAPEVAAYEKRNSAADVWSLGCVFMEMVTVLKGETIAALRSFLETRTATYRFYTSIEILGQWVRKLRSLGSDEDNIIFA
jgi:serine/threonine protein kinase